jgi:hypothetical protein
MMTAMIRTSECLTRPRDSPQIGDIISAMSPFLFTQALNQIEVCTLTAYHVTLSRLVRVARPRQDR